MQLLRTCTWPLPAGLQELYLATMDEIDRVSPGSALFILQGPQQQAAAGAGQQKWGNGFSADPALISQGLSGAQGDLSLRQPIHIGAGATAALVHKLCHKLRGSKHCGYKIINEDSSCQLPYFRCS